MSPGAGLGGSAELSGEPSHTRGFYLAMSTSEEGELTWPGWLVQTYGHDWLVEVDQSFIGAYTESGALWMGEVRAGFGAGGARESQP